MRWRNNAADGDEVYSAVTVAVKLTPAAVSGCVTTVLN